jgi:hypothetical protein
VEALKLRVKNKKRKQFKQFGIVEEKSLKYPDFIAK